jgi:branched-chain amino acid transport system permease protein
LAIGSVIIRNPGFTFVVLTLLLGVAIVQLLGQIAFFGGWGGILNIPRPDPIGPIEFTTNVACYYLMLFLLASIVLIFYALYTSRIGRAWRAIKLSPTLAQTLGINLYRYRLLAFVIASSAVGAVGSFYAHYYQVVIPDTFGGWASIYIQLYAVLGGLEFYIIGPAIGAAIMTFAPELLRVVGELEPIITGVLLLVIILFFPGGIVGTLRKFPRFGLAKIGARIETIKKWLITRGA